MISLTMAQQLKEAGLPWTPEVNDFFSVPGRGMDERTFVISDIMTYVEKRHNEIMITFHGALEWALDFVLLTDAVWLLSESQVREQLEHRLVKEALPVLTLTSTSHGYRCEIQHEGENLAFEAFGAADAYGKALHFLLQRGM